MSEELVRAFATTDAGLVAYPAKGFEDGSFLIEDVPGDSYLLELSGGAPYQQYFVLETRDPSFTRRTIGRPEIRAASSTNKLSVDLSGLAPWGADDDIEFFSLGSGTAFRLGIDFPAVNPADGDTVFNTVLDYGARLVGEPLVDASSGDVITVVQWRKTEGPGFSQSSIVSFLRDDSLEQQAGQTDSLTGVLSPSPSSEESSLENPWIVLGNELPANFDPNEVYASSILAASPFAHEHGLVGFTPLASFAPTPVVSSPRVTAECPSFFPSEWVWSYISLTMRNSILHAGQVYDVYSGITVEAPTGFDLSQHTVGFPRDVAFPTEVGATESSVTVSWQPPNGDPVLRYSVELLTLACESPCVPRLESVFWTDETQLVIPRDLLRSNSYAIRVSARRQSQRSDPRSSASIAVGPMVVSGTTNSQRSIPEDRDSIGRGAPDVLARDQQFPGGYELVIRR